MKKVKPKSITRILVFGTFDVLHKGHENFFHQARKLGPNPFLIVSVAKSRNVKKIKGSKPLHGEKVRLKKVRLSPYVDRAVLGAPDNYLRHVISLRPDIIALGYDQIAYTDKLEEKLLRQGLRVKIFRLKAFQPSRYKSSIIKQRKILN